MCSDSAGITKEQISALAYTKGPGMVCKTSRGTATGQYSTVVLNMPLVLQYDASCMVLPAPSYIVINDVPHARILLVNREPLSGP